VNADRRRPPPRAAYIHVPFCRHRCGYCNFTLIAGRDDLITAYLEAVARELSWLEEPREVETLFLGGGTPTHLSARQLTLLLETVRRWFPLAPGYEFSVEANPADVTFEVIRVLRDYGVNRLSLGVQSFDAWKLRTLERDHRREDIWRAWDLARPMDSLSLDLIFGVPQETRATWESDLRTALRLVPDHVSTYGLTFERGTGFWSRRQRGEMPPLAEEDERWLYETAIETLVVAGFQHYEVSNFARPGKRCRHNETYWTGGGYYAAGPGASRYVDGRRETNHRSTTTYLKRVLAGQSPVAESESLPDEDVARERLVFGLRRMQGVDRVGFAAETGFELDGLVGDELRRLLQQGFLQEQAGHLRLTRAGLLISDAIWPQLLRG